MLVTQRGRTERRILLFFVRYGLITQPASSVRGSSRRITIMRFRPADIRVINRRICLSPRYLLCHPPVRHPPQSGWLDELGRLKGGRGRGSRRRALRVLFHASELSATIRDILLADVLAHLLQLEPYSGHRVAASPEVFAGEVPLLSGKPCDGNRTLPFQETDHRGDWMLRWNRDAHVDVVRHEVPLHDLAFLLFRQSVEDRAQLAADIPKDCFPPSFGHEYNVVLAVPLGVG